jgi:rod shape-determining protein MreD
VVEAPAVPRASSTLRVVALVVVVTLVQAAFVSQLQVAGVAPDILLLLSVATGVAAGPDRGAIVGFLCGIGYDAYLQTPFGLSALVYCVVAYGVGLFQLPLATHPRWWRAGSVTLASAAGVVLWAGVALALGQDQVLDVPLARMALVVAAVNGVLSLPALRVASWAFSPLATERAR